MALLGEMHFRSSGPDSWFNLPRAEGIAYCAQEAWVQNETIKVRTSPQMFVITLAYSFARMLAPAPSEQHPVWTSV
jgi:hypothetical protein